MPNRPKDFSVTATAPASDDFQMIDGATNGTRKISAQHGANLRNALAPRGGVAFDGTSGSRVYTALTSQNIGTDSFSVSLIVDMPTSNPGNDRGVFYVGPSSGQNNVARTMYLEFKTAGELALGILGATTSDVRAASWNGFRAAYSGKRVHLLLVRDSSASTIALYVNGVVATPSTNALSSGSDPTWAGLVTSNFFQLGNNSASTQVWDRCIYSASLYNLALTAADVLEIYELGGAVPERFKFGSQAGLYTSDFSVDANAWAGVATRSTVAGNIDSISDGSTSYDNVLRLQQDATNGGGVSRSATRTSFSVGTFQKMFRLTGRYYIPSGQTDINGLRISTGDTTDMWLSGGTVGAWAALDATITKNGTSTSLALFPAKSGSLEYVAANSTDKVYIRDLVLRQVGAVCHLGLADGIGRIARDSSTNKLHAIRTATGVSDVIELDDGVVPYTTPSSANGPVIDTAGALRTDCVLVDVIVKNTTANAISGFGLGMSSGVRDLTYDTDIPANATRILPIKRADLTSLTLGTAPYGLVYFSAASWNSGLVKIVIRFRRERDL